jgi:ubiquinol-cytochrome c reductase cytochrome b subunit
MKFFHFLPKSMQGIVIGGLKYPVPPSINYFWNFGSLALLAFICQLITGIFLAMHYCSDINYAFLSVEHIMRDVNMDGYYVMYMQMVHRCFF